jgi:GrpB-like predicted nucleotidyltransferase (UPF0157 family)
MSPNAELPISKDKFPPMNPVIIVDYDPRWPEEFQTLRSQISAVLESMATEIEHVGSTAVPGLAAKPIIDIDVLLASAGDLPLVIKKLASIGYEHRGDLGITGREAFRSPPNAFRHHLYVCPPGSDAYREHITFRNYLRTHPQDADAYADLKRNLAARFIDNREAYTQAKTEYVTGILQRVSCRREDGPAHSRNNGSPNSFKAS